jgi:glutamate-1-semialdehyde 2,1-aminomutase
MTSLTAPDPTIGAASPQQTDLIRRARAIIPGGTSNSGVLPPESAFIVERGEGAELIDVDGRRIVDFVLGGGPVVLGHAHPRIGEAVARAISAGGHHFALQRRTIELAERLCELVPSAEMVRFSGSGSEATFHALRLARAVTGRQAIVKFDGGYHGHHDLASWSFEWSGSPGPEPVAESAGIQAGLADDIVVLPFNDAAAIRALLAAQPGRFAAVILEPIQRAIPATVAFLQACREACDRAGSVLIFDEIVTGFRCAPGGAQALWGVTPDLTALGKALGGGLPIAALVGRRAVMEHLDPSSGRDRRAFHCGTFNGYQLGSEAAHATLDILVDEGGIGQLDRLSRRAGEALRRAFAEEGIAATVLDGWGLFQHYFTDRPVERAEDVRATGHDRLVAWHRELAAEGVYKLPAKGYVSLAHEERHFEALEMAARNAAWRLTPA